MDVSDRIKWSCKDINNLVYMAPFQRGLAPERYNYPDTLDEGGFMSFCINYSPAYDKQCYWYLQGIVFVIASNAILMLVKQISF